jgi:3-oxoacyl-[acyl-carrier protein] reductase
MALGADVRVAAEVDEMVATTAREFGPVDVLVNNASAMPVEMGMRSFLEHSWEDFQTYFETVVGGAFNCARAVLPSMVARGRGRIVNIGTTSVHEMCGHLNPYVTAKMGLTGMGRSLAEEFGPSGITVNDVVPGGVWPYERDPDGTEFKSFRDRSPLGIGVVRPRDVAAAVVFLASDQAAGITGARLPVCAGQVLQD